MYLIAIGWMYVVLMMSITELSIVAGIMTFLFYGVIPLSIILYLLGTRQRRRNRAAAEKARDYTAAYSHAPAPFDADIPDLDSHLDSDGKPTL